MGEVFDKWCSLKISKRLINLYYDIFRTYLTKVQMSKMYGIVMTIFQINNVNDDDKEQKVQMLT